MFVSNTAGGGYQIKRSLRFRSSASASLTKTLAVPTDGKKWTMSSWVKLGSNTGAFFQANNGTAVTWLQLGPGGLTLARGVVGVNITWNTVTPGVFRDFSAHYHAVWVFDTAQATASNRVKIYLNGIQQITGGSYPSLNEVSEFNSSYLHTLMNGAVAGACDGYLSEINFIDGQALTPSSFGEVSPVTGQWQAKKYSGAYGTNGFYLPFTDNSAATATAIGADKSGNGNNWTPNNISLTAGASYDSMLDVPLGAGGAERGNYAVLNPLNNSGGATISDGNLKALWASESTRSVLSTFPIPSSGKFYAEFVVGTLTSGSVAASFGLATEGSSRTAMDAASMWVYYGSQQSYIIRSGIVSSQIGTNQTFAAGGVLQVAIDRDNNQAWLGYNDVWINSTNGTTGNPSAGTSPTLTSLPSHLFILVGMYVNNGSINFGQRPWAYTPPTGFKALHTGNLPDPVIKLPAQYMAATTYTGNGYPTAGTQSITNAVNGVSLQPDLVWIKRRDAAATHVLTDSARGVNSQLFSNQTAAQETNTDHVTAFTSSGFGLGTGTSGIYPSTNNNGASYIAWQWKANGAAVANNAGSIASQVSAGVAQGFSVVTYTGTGAAATVGHGLGVAPKMVIVKNRTNGAASWVVGHASLTNGFASNYSLSLNDTSAQGNGGTPSWNATNPTSTVFSLGALGNVNASGQALVAYCFSEVAGYSKFGSYVGNGSADGPFVYCGFRPKFVMVKRVDSTTDWLIYDTARSTYNESNLYLGANVNTAEAAGVPYDILSNGFKCRNTVFNASGGTYIFACFAESPFKNSLAR